MEASLYERVARPAAFSAVAVVLEGVQDGLIDVGDSLFDGFA